MKLTSYLCLVIGVFLLIIEFIFKFNDMLGYTITTLGVLLSIFGVLTIRKLRELLANLFINFF